MDFRKKTMLALVRRACSIPAPVARALKVAGLLVVILMMCLQLPSIMRPYATDLVLRTSDLSNAIAVSSKPLGDDRNLSVNGTADGPRFPSKHVMDCGADIGRLADIKDRHELDDHIEYLKRYIRFTRKPIERQSYTLLQQSLLHGDAKDGGFERIQLSASNDRKKECRQPLEVSVTQSRFPADVDLSDFIFAIATTTERMNHPTTISEWAFWLTDGNGRPNGGKLLVRLLDATEPELKDVAQRLADAGIDAEVSAWDSRFEKEMAVRYFKLVPLMYQAAPTRKWFVLCDDDTFFTAMNGLVAELKRFDHAKPFYIGTLSEDMNAVSMHGSHAYGGAGIFISRTLAKAIHGVHEKCTTRAKVRQSNTGYGAQGDIILRQCIYDNTDVRLTVLRDLWQFDLSGDVSGFYESGFKPQSIHHFKSGFLWHLAYPLNTTKVAHTCGEDCPYQRFITTDNFIISNGYSIAQYPDGIDFNLDQVERTFHSIIKDKPQNFDLALGPQRPSLQQTGKKIAWELRESHINMEDGSVSQIYIRKKDDERWATKDGKGMKALDGVIELVWVPE
jgi:hypothetical protein